MGILVETRIHQQNVGTFCGAACAQMTLAALGLDPSTLAQREIYEASTDGDWLSRPDKLTSALNARWGNASGLRFRLYRCADKAGMLGVMRGMFEQFSQNGAVGIALWGSNRHWIVVRGFDTDPTDSSIITALHVRNPLPAIGGSDAADQQHAHDDDCCAEHRVCYHFSFMNIDYWNSTVKPVEKPGPWKDEFLVICPAAYVPGLPDDEEVPPTPEIDTEIAPPTGPILSAQEVAAHVERMVVENSFAGLEEINEAIKLTRAGTPILVEALNDDGSINPEGAYYLVPFLDDEGNWGDPGSVPMAMTVNAFTGEYEEVVGAPDGSIYDPEWISVVGIERQASSNNLEPLRNRAQQDSDFPYLAVWRHTEQTPTRFWPLFVEDRPAAGDAGDAEDDAASRGSPPAYMRIDGQVITSLDDLHP